jgi:hypothetical protein
MWGVVDRNDPVELLASLVPNFPRLNDVFGDRMTDMTNTDDESQSQEAGG